MRRAIHDATACREALLRLLNASASFGSSGALSTKPRHRRISAASCWCELSLTGCRRSLSAASARSGSVSSVNLLSSSTGAKRCGYLLVPS